MNGSSADHISEINGVLKFNKKQFLILDVSSALIGSESNVCPQVCIFQQYFSNQESYKLIGTVDISLNGPGLKKYLIYDETNNKLMNLDLWGEPSFIDLDADVFDTIQKNPGDFIKLNEDNYPPVITISNDASKHKIFYNYEYDQGILKKIISK